MKTTTAKLADFLPQPLTKKDTSMKFNTAIRCRKGKYLTVSLPETFVGKRVEAYFSANKLIVALSKGEDGVKVSRQSVGNYKRFVAQFGYKKWVKGMPEADLKLEVSFADDHFQADIPSPVKIIPVNTTSEEKPSKVTARDKAKNCLLFLNKFAEKHEYAFEVFEGKLKLIRSETIG